MSARLILSAGLLGAVGTAAWSWWWFVRCEQACAATERRAHDLFERDELLDALNLLDAVDRRCHCARFTTGDAPPQYSLAVACLRRLQNEGRSVEAQQVLAQARGPVLKGLARSTSHPRS